MVMTNPWMNSNMIYSIGQRLFPSLQVPVQILEKAVWSHWDIYCEGKLYKEQRGKNSPGPIKPTQRPTQCRDQDVDRQEIPGPTIRRWDGLSFQEEKERSC